MPRWSRHSLAQVSTEPALGPIRNVGTSKLDLPSANETERVNPVRFFRVDKGLDSREPNAAVDLVSSRLLLLTRTRNIIISLISTEDEKNSALPYSWRGIRSAFDYE